MIEAAELVNIEIEKERRRRWKERKRNDQTALEAYRTAPWQWMHDRLGVPLESIDWNLLPEYANHKWDGTENPLMEIMKALVNSEWVGVESATGCSKTFIGAAIALWFLECFENSLVVTTAPKQDQLTLHIWKEISKFYKKFGKGYLDALTLRMKKDDNGKKSYEWSAIGFVAGTSAEKETEDKAQGFHAEHMLIIFEETPGIPKPIINTFKLTSQAPHNLILALGNPNHQLDNLHLFCKLPRVKHIRISGLDYPNIVLKNPSFIPGGKSEQGIQDILEDVGSVDHPRYLSRVRGISPAQSSDSLIQVKWCYEAVERKPEDAEQGLKAMGVDVANSEAGDQAAIAFGKGGHLISITAFQCPDSNQLGKKQVKEKIEEEKIDPRYVGIDGVGVGAGTINALKEYGIRVSNLIGGASPIKIPRDAHQYKNLRSQMWWQARLELRNGEISMLKDEELISDLCAPTYADNDKYIIVESKDDIKKRLGRSPNKGDAFVYWNWVRKPRRVISSGKSIF